MSYSAAWKIFRMSGDAKTGPSGRELGGSPERQRVDQVDLLPRRHLDQAGLVEVVVERIRLGIDTDHLLAQSRSCASASRSAWVSISS